MLNFSSGCNSPSEQLEIHTLLPVTDLGSLVQKSSARHIPNFGWGSVPPVEQLDIRTHGCLKRLLIDFLTKMSYFTSQNVGNPVQIIKIC